MKTPNTKDNILSSNQQEAQYIEQQKKKLTKKENMALNIILNELNFNKNGNISILELVKKSKISRPVFTNLLMKLQVNGDAEIWNQGAKGTYIKFINTEILKNGGL